MTVIIAYATPEVAFLASDSRRWDIALQRNGDPVRKVHRVSSYSAVALGGSLIDRTRLAAELITARHAGDSFPDAARRLSPPLFAETRKLMDLNGVTGEQFFTAWYAETGPKGCHVFRHRLPEDQLAEVRNFDVMGPDTPWLVGQADELIATLAHDGRISLDAFAYELIGRAAASDPKFVGYPGMAVILRCDGTSSIRVDLDPRCWSGPHKDFDVCVS